MIETLLLPFQFPFMQNGFLISLIVSPAAALLSCFLVLKGWALMGDAVSHAILPGVVLAYLLGIPLIVGAFTAGMGCSLLTGYLAENSRVKRDTVMGVVFSGMFAVGLILFVAFPSDAHLDQILFGNMLGVGPADLWTGLAISGPVVAVLSLKWRDFLLHAFDPAQAQAAGLNTRLLHYGLLTILSLVVVAVLASVGLILAVALLVTPGAIAFLVTRSFGRMLVVSVVVCTGSMLTGIYASFWLDSAPAPTIVLVLTGLFLAAFTARRIQVARQSRADREKYERPSPNERTGAPL
jgi:manganese/iron transport system permease protein